MIRRNIELKARLHDVAEARAVCAGLGAEPQGELRQTDTYFRVPEGRLKLRASEPGEDYLVFYRRPDAAAAKGCDYEIQFVDRAAVGILGHALGVIAVVEKVRELHLWRNVRIHLDEVAGLGRFIEFEAVLAEGESDEDGHAKLAYLQEAFGIAVGDVEAVSYLELVLGAGT